MVFFGPQLIQFTCVDDGGEQATDGHIVRAVVTGGKISLEGSQEGTAKRGNSSIMERKCSGVIHIDLCRRRPDDTHTRAQRLNFLPRDAVLARYMLWPCLCVSVCCLLYTSDAADE